MPAWSEWVTFILGTATALIAIGAAALAFRRRRQRLRIGCSIQPYALGGTRIGNGPIRPRELLQLDITNVSGEVITIADVRMRLRGDKTERPVFDEATGVSWIVRKPIDPGAGVVVKCSAQNEALLDRIQCVTVYLGTGRPARLGGGAIRREARRLKRMRGDAERVHR